MAAMAGGIERVIDHWLSGIRDLCERQQQSLAGLEPAAAQARLCELNVLQQVHSLCRTTVLKRAWERGQAVDVHGWI